jgi:cyclase
MSVKMLGLWGLAWVLCLSCARADEAPLFELQEVGRGVWAAVSPSEGPAGSNAGFVIGSDSVLVVDTFQEPAAAEALLKAIRAKTSLPVRYVVNTHYHLDHVAGNGVFQSAGAVILAQANVHRWEHTENLKFFGAQITPQQRDTVAGYVLPSILYQDGVELMLGDRKVVVRVLPGHTGGDSIVWVPDADAVFTGDLFWNHCLPNLIDADTLRQIESNQGLAKQYPSAAFVPGHGEVAKAADVRAFADYLARLRAAVASALGKGVSGEGLHDRVLAELKANYGGWTYFDYFVGPNIAQTEQEFAGRKRLPPAP